MFISYTVISCAFTLPEETTDLIMALAIFPAPIDVKRKKTLLYGNNYPSANEQRVDIIIPKKRCVENAVYI